MEGSTVYFTDFRCQVGTSLTEKLRRLCIAAGIRTIEMDGRFVAIKMHFGELGNLAFLRPNYAKVVADLCKEQGGMPFLTDCNTLYPGRRKNALEHLECAQLNGFWPMTTGCQVLIGDGLRGTDEVEVPVPNGEYCKTAKIGRAIMDADIFISLTHFKGHESTGFGGAIKNIGMGCGSRAGKMDQHSSGAPAVQRDADIYELALADVYVGAGVTAITQSNITDRRYNTSLCGIVVGVVEQIDPSSITAQFDNFFELYRAIISEEYNAYVSRISGYESNAAADYEAFLQSLEDYEASAEAEFEAWFEEIKDKLGTDVAGQLAQEVQELENRVSALEAAIENADVFTSAAWLANSYLGCAYLSTATE